MFKSSPPKGRLSSWGAASSPLPASVLRASLPPLALLAPPSALPIPSSTPLLLGGPTRSPTEEKAPVPPPLLPPILCSGAAFIAVTPLPSRSFLAAFAGRPLNYSSIPVLFRLFSSSHRLPPPPPAYLASHYPLLHPPARYPACLSTATKERPEGAARWRVAGTWGFLPTHPWPLARDRSHLSQRRKSSPCLHCLQG